MPEGDILFDFTPEPTPAAEVTPAPVAADPALAQQVEELKRSNALQEQRLRDAARYLDPSAAAPTPQTELEQLQYLAQTNGAKYVEVNYQREQRLLQQAVQTIKAENDIQSIISQHKTEKPYLAPFEDAISDLANKKAMQLRAQGQAIDPRTIIKQAVDEMDAKVKALPGFNAQQTGPAPLSFAPNAAGQPQGTNMTQWLDSLPNTTAGAIAFNKQYEALKAAGKLPR
jgi:hypothetical protein